jgi:hypothetical protein
MHRNLHDLLALLTQVVRDIWRLSFKALSAPSKRIGKRRCDMCNGRFGLVRRRFGWKQFCCKACMDNYLSRTTREAHRSRSWLEFLARKE